MYIYINIYIYIFTYIYIFHNTASVINNTRGNTCNEK